MLCLTGFSRFTPIYFDKNIDSGIPVLTPAGRKAIEEEVAAKYE